MTHGIHPEEESVRPSSVLIDELHRRLFDPGVVSAFEREHRRRRGVEDRDHYLMDGVVRPRWVLLPAAIAAAAAGGSEGSIVVEATTDVRDNVVEQRHEDANDTMALTRRYRSNDNTDDELCELEIIDPRHRYPTTTKKSGDERYNKGSIPTRNYIDLRMEQNRIFADDRSRKCHDVLSTIKLLDEKHTSGTERSSSSTNDNNNDELLLLEKHAKLLRSLLYEGLCACPNHVGLLRVRTNYAEWLRRGRNVEMSDDDTCTKSTLISRHNDTQYNSSINVARPPPRKGVEGRTHAAMHDVRTERSFLAHGDGGGDDGDAAMIRGYSLLPPTAIDDTMVMYDVAAVKDGRRKNSFEHHGESNGNESPPYCKERRQRRRKHDRRRRGKDDRSCKRRRRIEYEQSSSSLLHHRHHRHRRRSRSRESSGSNRSEVSRSSSYTHSLSSSSSSSSYSRLRKHRHRKEEKKSRRSSKSKAKKSKKSKHYHHRKSRSCDTVEEEGK